MENGTKNPIREKELQRLKNSIKIGDRINVKTLKVSQGRHASGATSAMAVVRGTVVAKYPYPHLVLVVLSSGLMESATWAELVVQKREKSRKAGGNVWKL